MAWFRRRRSEDPERTGINAYSLQQYIQDYFTYAGNVYPMFSLGTQTGNNEATGGAFEWFVQSAYRTSGIVFACMAARLAVFSDVRFQFRQVTKGVPGDFVGGTDGRNPANSGLELLRRPWFSGTTGDLLGRMIQDADLAGNAFIVRRKGQLVRLRPDWVSIVATTPEGASLWHPDAELNGYLYKPGGPATDDPPIAFLREEVAHFAPQPDPLSRFRGISWIEPVLSEIMGDKAATQHQEAFFNQGATVNMILEYPDTIKREMFQAAVQAFKDQHEGVDNAYKTLHVMGATARTVGADMLQADLTNIKGATETRIAAAAGVPAVVVGFSEGLKGSALNAGNYQMAKRNFADKTIRPLWRSACGSLETIIPPPPGAELWFNDADVAFLREDQQDLATIRKTDAETISSLVTSGFTPNSAAEAVTSGDMRKLVHSGLVSVQLNPPGKNPAPEVPQQQQMPMMPAGAAPTNGKAT